MKKYTENAQIINVSTSETQAKYKNKSYTITKTYTWNCAVSGDILIEKYIEIDYQV